LDRTVNPGYTLVVTNIAHDTDVPAQSLTFSFLNPPPNTSINTTSGVVSFSPSYGQFGTTNNITVVVTDSGSPAMSATNTFKAIVIANTAPVLAAIANHTLNAGDVLVITNFATDAEAPPQLLSYALAVAPTGATINATNGWLTWATSGTDAGSTNGFTVLVADNGVPSLLAARSFSVTVGSTSTPPSGAWTMAKLPDTGQTQSYTATVGEDSDYTVNPPSFTDNGDGTVKDNVTGLTWQKADGGEMTWASAGLYAQTNRVGGQSDWRLPTSHEAFSILNRGTVNPALNTTYFTLSAAQYWWSADPQVGDATRIWTINAGGGIGAHRQDETVSAGGTNRYHVRCVRGVALTGQPVHHFTNNLDGTITDLDTGLIWQQAEASAMNWESALQYAEELSFAGRTDWRLPNIKELQSINDETRANPSVDTNYFISANSSRHWSSTTVMNGTNRAWNVDFQFGLVSYEDKLSSLFVRCVRGGVTNSTPSTNSFTAQFAMMPAGQYQMGDHFGFVDPAHPSDEIPVHTVAVDSFYMETTLLTCLEYVQFLNSALAQGLVEVRSNYVYGVGGTNIYCDTYGSDTNSRVQWTGSAFTILNNRALHPITGIRWFGAIAYCNWASTRDGYAPCYNLTTGECGLTNSGYRLPTEAEWEYAARGGLYSPYGMFPWGSDTNADGTLANWAGKSHPFATGSTPWTTPVGFYNGSLQYQTNFNWPGSSATYQTRNNANGFGLYDMSGNVWEWINDWYAKDYYTNCVLNNIVTNPPGPVTGDPMPDGKPCRGLRGGNWFNGEDQYGHGRVANRDPSYFRGPGDPNGPWFHVGFRVMRRGYASVVATGATLTNLASGLHFTEGPAADAAGNVFFSDITADTIYKWSAANQLSVFRTNSGGANGICFDASGNLLACEGDNGRLVSITPQGTLTVVASNYAGLRFNEPNDLWIDPAGGVYFTDPVFFGHTAVQGGEYVYYLSPNRSSVIRVVTDMVRPNGLVGTPDGKTLYLADWGSGNVFRYSINTDGTLTNKTLFAQVKCDGMTLDAEGHLYLTENAIFVYDSTGNPLEQISVPERPTNLEFGGSDRKTLFITTDAGSLYSIRMRVQGATNAVVTTNQAPVITNTAISPSIPTTNDTVWVTARITDDVSVAGVSLTYSTGSGGGASQTNTAFLETMGLIPAKPWSGIGANNTWTVTGSSFEQRAGANYGAGNTNGLEFKGGTTNLTDSMIATTGSINALGSAGFVEFWIQTLTISNQYGNAGWTFQLDSGSGYVTRLSELTSSSHGWMLYHYNLQTSELVSSLKLRFQFRGGSVESRMDLDQISVKVITGGASSSTNVAMFDDGAHNDGTAGDGTYGTSIPAMPTGTAVTYYLTATDGADLSTVSPVGAPSTTYSYMVQAATSNSPPVIANTIASPSSPTATNSVWVTAQVTDNLSVATVRLSYNTGAGATNVAMLDDGLHQDGAAGDGTYGGQIPAFPVGTTVSYYLIATDGAGLSTTNPVGAPSATFSYTVRSTSTTQTVGLFLNTSNAWPGYTLMAPMHHTNTYMLNNAGEVVHVWTSTYEPGRSAYLMTNGHLFRAGMVKSGGPSTGGGEGGRIEEYDWDGNLVWAIDYYSSTYIHHHDFKVLPNGNVLMLVAEKKTLAEVIAAGFNTNLLDPSIFTQGYMLPDCLVEVTPTRPYGGTVVWEWHLWDHMIQDYDPTKNNYGVVANHPERIDVNGTGIKIPQFWNHVNGIDHNAQLDQVMLSIRGNSELFVIDHQTTTAQAAGTNGGRYSKGGDILYRWGNPAQYNRGTAANQQLFQQHHTHWIETNCPGAGNILIYNNGIGRGYSTINQIVPPVDAAGNYTISTGAAFGPTTPVWTYTATPPTNFYSAEISGAERLPNGNTLICEGIKGNLFEVTSAGQTVWRYVCPVTTTIMTQGDSIPVDPARTDQLMNAVFRVNRYATNYAGLLGRDLTAQGTIELPVDQTLRVVTSQATSSSYQFSWSSLPYRNYAVLYKVSLSATTWTSIATNRSIGTLTTFTDSNAARLSLPQGYYRVMQVP
jgi:sugar lactone lactonase YvrE/formylglycine-generating enzyme required for sulfatase activity